MMGIFNVYFQHLLPLPAAAKLPAVLAALCIGGVNDSRFHFLLPCDYRFLSILSKRVYKSPVLYTILFKMSIEVDGRFSYIYRLVQQHFCSFSIYLCLSSPGFHQLHPSITLFEMITSLFIMVYIFRVYFHNRLFL